MSGRRDSARGQEPSSESIRAVLGRNVKVLLLAPATSAPSSLVGAAPRLHEARERRRQDGLQASGPHSSQTLRYDSKGHFPVNLLLLLRMLFLLHLLVFLKTPPLSQVPTKIDHHFHYLDIQAIESKKPNQIVFK